MNRIVTCRCFQLRPHISEIAPRKNRSCIWSRSHDMVTYIYHAFRNNFLFFFLLFFCLFADSLSAWQFLSDTYAAAVLCFSFPRSHTYTYIFVGVQELSIVVSLFGGAVGGAFENHVTFGYVTFPETSSIAFW